MRSKIFLSTFLILTFISKATVANEMFVDAVLSDKDNCPDALTAKNETSDLASVSDIKPIKEGDIAGWTGNWHESLEKGDLEGLYFWMQLLDTNIPLLIRLLDIQRQSDGKTLLHLIAEEKNSMFLKGYKDEPANIQLERHPEEEDNVFVTRLALHIGANPYIQDSLGRTPYDIAVEKGNNNVARLLPKKVSQNISELHIENVQESQNITELRSSSLAYELTSDDITLDNMSLEDLLNLRNRSLYTTEEMQYFAEVKFLQYQIINAIKEKNISKVTSIFSNAVSRGVDLTVLNNIGVPMKNGSLYNTNLLILAARFGDQTAVQFFARNLFFKIDLQLFDSTGKNASHIIFEQGSSEKLQAIIQSFDFSQIAAGNYHLKHLFSVLDSDGNAPIHLLVIHNNLKLLPLIADSLGSEFGSLLKMQDSDGNTPMHLALIDNNLEAFSAMALWAVNTFSTGTSYKTWIGELEKIKNHNGKTILDIFEYKQFEIKKTHVIPSNNSIISKLMMPFATIMRPFNQTKEISSDVLKNPHKLEKALVAQSQQIAKISHQDMVNIPQEVIDELKEQGKVIIAIDQSNPDRIYSISRTASLLSETTDIVTLASASRLRHIGLFLF